MADERVVQAVKVVDPTTTSQIMSVDSNGNAGVILAANSGVDIGDVDITSQIPGTGATNLGKAQDTGVGATDTGVAVLAVRDDALSAITPAADDYAVMRVDANGALWTHDDVLEAAISGTEMQVDVVAALPAGTNAIGKLAANSGVDIGDVDITSQIPGVGATNLGKAEDAPHASGDTGVAMWGVRNDSNGTSYGADQDYCPISVDSNGNLQVDVLSGGAATVPTNATVNVATTSSLAAGSTADLDSAEISEAEYLWRVDITGSVPFKALIRMRENGSDNALHVVVFGKAGELVQWSPPHANFFTHAGSSGGEDLFQVEITNMDASEAADFYCTFFYST